MNYGRISKIDTCRGDPNNWYNFYRNLNNLMIIMRTRTVRRWLDSLDHNSKLYMRPRRSGIFWIPTKSIILI